MTKIEIWGPITWIFFHTLIEKIKDNAPKYIVHNVFDFIFQICRNLPCPNCTEHATKHLSLVNVSALTKKTLKDFMYLFHNKVNAFKKKELFNFTYINMYKQYVLYNRFILFSKVFNTKGNMHDITANFQRSLIIKNIANWLNNNKIYFVLHNENIQHIIASHSLNNNLHQNKNSLDKANNPNNNDKLQSTDYIGEFTELFDENENNIVINTLNEPTVIVNCLKTSTPTPTLIHNTEYIYENNDDDVDDIVDDIDDDIDENNDDDVDENNDDVDENNHEVDEVDDVDDDIDENNDDVDDDVDDGEVDDGEVDDDIDENNHDIDENNDDVDEVDDVDDDIDENNDDVDDDVDDGEVDDGEVDDDIDENNHDIDENNDDVDDADDDSYNNVLDEIDTNPPMVE